MASIRVDGHEVPIVFPLDEGGRATVFSHLLHVRFKFVESSIYIEEEQYSEAGQLQQSFPTMKSVSDEGHYWYLGFGNYRAYGLPLPRPSLSTEVASRQSVESTTDTPFISQSSRCLVFTRSEIPAIVKVEKLDTIVELSSE